MPNYSVFVNTTDKFEDCWVPFFKLFAKFWPEFNGVIYLNTEFKDFEFPGLNIICLKNCAQKQLTTMPTWSECLINGLGVIHTDVVLYMQEDYFFNANVNNADIEKYVKLLLTSNIDCIHLTTASGGAPFSSTIYPDLNEISKYAKYRISCQAALWKKPVLESYVRKHENPWQFEKYGTMRARVKKHNLYAINKDFYDGNTVMPYVLTGIIQGKWKEEVVALFEANDIKVDFSARGFFKRDQKRSIYRKLRTRVPKLWKEMISICDLIYLRFKKN